MCGQDITENVHQIILNMMLDNATLAGIIRLDPTRTHCRIKDADDVAEIVRRLNAIKDRGEGFPNGYPPEDL